MSWLDILEKASKTVGHVSSPHIILGCTGSVASIKVPELAHKFCQLGAEVLIVPTHSSCHFLKRNALCLKKDQSCPPTKAGVQKTDDCAETSKRKSSVEIGIGLRCDKKQNNKSKSDIDRDVGKFYCLCNSGQSSSGNKSHSYESISDINCDCAIKYLYQDLTFVIENDEWAAWQEMGDPVAHIQLRGWADVMVIAPLDANTLAKLAQGLCDNLLTCITRAWDSSRPFLFCPAMNTHMYNHPLTAKHIHALKELGYLEVEVTSKRLACGDIGPGAMAELDTIVDAVMESLAVSGKL